MPNNTYDLSSWGIGAILGFGLLGILIWLVFLIAYIKIISKAGYSGWWVLIMFVPIVNVIMLLVFAYKEWPIQREVRELRAWAEQIQRGPGPQQFGYGQSDSGPEQRYGRNPHSQ